MSSSPLLSDTTSPQGPMAGGKMIAWVVLTSLFLMIATFYILLQVFAPDFVRKSDCDKKCGDKAPVDYGKCLGYSFVISVVLLLLFALLGAMMKA